MTDNCSTLCSESLDWGFDHFDKELAPPYKTTVEPRLTATFAREPLPTKCYVGQLGPSHTALAHVAKIA